MRKKLFDTRTGLWFRAGRGFTEPCLFKATAMDEQAVARVRLTIPLGYAGEHVVGGLDKDGEMPDCTCEDCTAEAQE